MRTLEIAGALLAFSVAATVASAAPIAVTSCGMVVKGSARLAGDLDCSAHPGHALILDGKLDLQGFSLIGNPGWVAVDCGSVGKCGVKGPGEIRGAAVGISGYKILVSRGVRIADSAETGIVAAIAKLNRAIVEQNGNGATSSPGGGGVWAGVVSATRSEITGNAAFGVFGNGGAVRLVNSTVTGNGVASPLACGTALCADVVSFLRPRVFRTTCGTSMHVTGATWGVCAGD